MERQSFILESVARMIDAGRLRTTVGKVGHGLTAENIRQAHLRQLTGKMIGKQVVTV